MSSPLAALQQLLAPLRQRVLSMIGRAVLEAVDDERKLQEVQASLLAGERASGVEHFQHYGFTSRAHPGAEGIALALAGNRGHLVVINIDDRTYRLRNLETGEVALYDDLGQVVKLARDRVQITSPMLVQVEAPQITLIAPLVRVEGELQVTGDILDRVDTTPKSLQGLRNVYNIHVHPENDNGGPTDDPNQQV